MQSESSALSGEALAQPIQIKTKTGRSEFTLMPSLGGALSSLKLWHPRLMKTMQSCVPAISENDVNLGNPYYKGVLLYPFVNRLDGGAYQFQGNHYQFPVNERLTNTALHGFVFNRTPEINVVHPSDSELIVTLVFNHDAHFKGFPFLGCLTVKYCLSDSDGFSVEFFVENLGQEDMPIGLGWHPYFCVAGDLSDWQLSLPAVEIVEINSRLLPTGKFGAFDGFRSLHTLGNIQFDNCFHLTETAPIQTTTLWSPTEKTGLCIWQQARAGQFNYLQLCIPPERNAIAIEPVTSNINALNNHQGLISLAPKGEYRVSCGVRCE